MQLNAATHSSPAAFLAGRLGLTPSTPGGGFGGGRLPDASAPTLPGLPTVEGVSGLRDRFAAVKRAEQAAVDAITGKTRTSAAAEFDPRVDRLKLDSILGDATARNARRNLDFSAAASGALGGVRQNLTQARDLIADLLDGTRDTSDPAEVAAAQAELDGLFGAVDELSHASFAGRRIFVGDAERLGTATAGGVVPDVPEAPPEAHSLTDAAGYVDFTKATFESFSNQDKNGGETVDPLNARAVSLTGNAHKSIDLGRSHTVTENTYLEFEFRSTKEGESQGLSLENDNGTSTDRMFKVFGTQGFGTQVDSYAGGGAWQSFRVKVGDFIAAGESFDRLVAFNDADNVASLGANSSFRNVRVVEEAGASEATADGSGLDATYYAGKGFGGAVLGSEVDARVHRNYGGGDIGGSGRRDHVTARFEGKVQADEAGSYQFRTKSDDGVRVYVGGELIVDNWTDHGPQYDYGTKAIDFDAAEGKEIVVEYYEKAGGGVLELEWMQPGGQWERVDDGRLYRTSEQVSVETPGVATPEQFVGVPPEVPADGDAGPAEPPLAGPPDVVAQYDGAFDAPTRRFAAGDLAATSGYDLPIGSVTTGRLGGSSGTLASLKGGNPRDLATLIAGGDLESAMATVTEALAAVRVQQGALDGFARGSEALRRVAESKLEVVSGAATRLDEVRAAEQAAQAARQQMRDEAKLLAATLADYDRQTILSVLA